VKIWRVEISHWRGSCVSARMSQKQWCRNEFESGYGAQVLLSCPSTFWLYKYI